MSTRHHFKASFDVEVSGKLAGLERRPIEFVLAWSCYGGEDPSWDSPGSGPEIDMDVVECRIYYSDRDERAADGRPTYKVARQSWVDAILKWKAHKNADTVEDELIDACWKKTESGRGEP